MVVGVFVNIIFKIWNFGVIMDVNFILFSYINDFCKKVFFFINFIGCIWKYLFLDIFKWLVNVFVILYLDYCNSFLYGLFFYEFFKL